MDLSLLLAWLLSPAGVAPCGAVTQPVAGADGGHQPGLAAQRPAERSDEAWAPAGGGAGAYFSVSLRVLRSLDDVAAELAVALGTRLEQSDEPGLRGDWVGEVLGLRLWLFVAEPPEPGVPPRYALIGAPEHDCPPGVEWPDLSEYVSQLLSARTGRPWRPSTSED